VRTALIFEAPMTMLDVQELQACLRVSDDGLCRLDRRVYTDPAIFDLEMKHVWEKLWLYVAHESQLPNPHDYITAQIGRQPVVVMRDEAGAIGVFINACTHRGPQLYRASKGNARRISCPYHAWTFDSGGRLVAVKEEATGGYPPSFDKSTLGLERVARMESYRGFVFASLNPAAVPLREHLGDAAAFIDLLVDQSEQGLEFLKGNCTYTYDGNWKLQAENSVDGYHATTVHGNFTATIQNRLRSNSRGEKIKSMRLERDASRLGAGFFDLGHGHVMLWRDWDNAQDRSNYGERENLARRMGDVKMKWALLRLRNVLIYPNLMLADNFSTQLRVIQPLSVDKTKVTGYVLAPKGEDPEQRRLRLRSYEDFFNPSGMATPDDLAVFNLSQKGFMGTALRCSDLSRGAAHQVAGANAYADELGIRPLASGALGEDEGLYVGNYKYWMELLTRGMQEEAGEESGV
jgi:benzoate/toluate 1,2-dioxygenase alpha subunit